MRDNVSPLPASDWSIGFMQNDVVGESPPLPSSMRYDAILIEREIAPFHHDITLSATELRRQLLPGDFRIIQNRLPSFLASGDARSIRKLTLHGQFRHILGRGLIT